MRQRWAKIYISQEEIHLQAAQRTGISSQWHRSECTFHTDWQSFPFIAMTDFTHMRKECTGGSSSGQTSLKTDYEGFAGQDDDTVNETTVWSI